MSFLGGSNLLFPGQKRMIHRGVWHRTDSCNAEALDLLEVETPSDKHDLIRLDDAYGRAGKPYEGDDAVEDSEPVDLDAGITIGRYRLSTNWLPGSEPRVAVFLSGGIVAEKVGVQVLGPGDVVTANQLGKLASQFHLETSKVVELVRADVL